MHSSSSQGNEATMLYESPLVCVCMDEVYSIHMEIKLWAVLLLIC